MLGPRQDIVQRFGKYCTRCKTELDLNWKWHLPFCKKCRQEVITILKDEQIEMMERIKKEADEAQERGLLTASIPLEVWMELKKDKKFMKEINERRKKYGFEKIEFEEE